MITEAGGRANGQADSPAEGRLVVEVADDHLQKAIMAAVQGRLLTRLKSLLTPY